MRSLPHRFAMLDLRSSRPAQKKADPFYLSAEWRALLEKFYRVRPRVCVQCGRTGCRLYADHVIALEDGGAALDMANLQLLCGACHTRKSNAERARRQAQRYV